MKRYMQYAISLVAKPILAEHARLNGLKAVRLYIATIGKVRIGAMAAVGGIAALSLLVCGFVLFIGGLLAVLGVSGQALAWTALIIGAILTIAAIAGYFIGFSERRWLEASRSYELMNALVDPVPSPKAVPKNIAAAFKGEPTEHVPRSRIQPHYNPPYQRRHRASLTPQPV